MIRFSLTELARELPAVLHGADAEVLGVGSDSRTLEPGQLFVALRGPNFDGHDYLEAAARRGAAGALVDHHVSDALPCLQVEDTRLGLGRLGALWRQKSPAQMVAVTGSNGKTTVKEMLAAILSRVDETLATRGNLNNDIGLPLTLCRLQEERFAVVELGANHPGEIGYLSRLARPDVAVLNNAGRAHLEGFGSVEAVARAKAEILEGLDGKGVFVFNADDPHAPLWRELAEGVRRIGFGVREAADVTSPAGSLELRWDEAGFHSEFEVRTPSATFRVSLALTGEHNRMNALAAIAAAHALGVPEAAMVEGLASLRPVVGRLAPRRGPKGVRVVDDSYNANPESVRMAVEVLCRAPGRRLLVLGDLGELGADAEALHGELGLHARQRGVDLLLTCGRLSRAAAESFGGGARHFDTREALVEALAELLRPGDTVLVKGSRAAAMDRVVEALCGEVQAC